MSESGANGYIEERYVRHIHTSTDTVQNDTDPELSTDASETCEEAGKRKDQLRLYMVSVSKTPTYTAQRATSTERQRRKRNNGVEYPLCLKERENVQLFTSRRVVTVNDDNDQHHSRQANAIDKDETH